MNMKSARSIHSASGSLIAPFFGREVHVWPARAASRRGQYLPDFGGPLDEGRQARLPVHGAAFDMASRHRLESGAEETAPMFLSTRVEDGRSNYVWGE